MTKSSGSGNPKPSEDVKRRFREALEKKHAHGGADVSEDAGHGKIDRAQRAATSATQQMFRRKSG